MNHSHLVNSSDHCSDCGTAVGLVDGEERCPTCFEQHLYAIDAGFLENYRKFGGRGHLVVAETCLRALVLDTPDHRKVLAMSIFEQYVLSMTDLAGLFTAFLKRHEAPIVKTFMEFKLDADSALNFFDIVRTLSDVELCSLLDLPLPHEIAERCKHLSPEDAHQLSISVYHLMQELRIATEQGGEAALALAQISGGLGSAVIATDDRWLNGKRSDVAPDEVAVLMLDSKHRSIRVQGISADEGSMAQVVAAVDTVTRAASNLVYAYLQSHNL